MLAGDKAPPSNLELYIKAALQTTGTASKTSVELCEHEKNGRLPPYRGHPLPRPSGTSRRSWPKVAGSRSRCASRGRAENPDAYERDDERKSAFVSMHTTWSKRGRGRWRATVRGPIWRRRRNAGTGARARVPPTGGPGRSSTTAPVQRDVLMLPLHDGDCR
jgi:hypothetical protein